VNLEEQVASLIDGAPDIATRMSVSAIAPVLQQVAANLPHTSYYVCQNEDGDWAVTSLRHRQQLELEIKVIYAFSHVEGMKKFYDRQPEAELAAEIPIIYLLFEILTLPTLDRVIFFNNPTNFDRGQELSRAYLEELIVEQLEQLQAPDSSSNLPPDVC
jgi:hypothetical protein